jgi:arsenate reductase (glutaredoxin)
MTITIYHNPACGTSRTVLEHIRARGFEPEIILYLKNPPDSATIRSLAQKAGVALRDLMRAKEKLFADLGLDDQTLSDDALLTAIAQHPVLLNRPIVVTAQTVRLCRPSDRVLEILPTA